MKPQIIVDIDPNGNVTMEGIGFKGTACDKAMAEIEKAVGIQSKRVNKPEYSAIGSTATFQKVGGQ
jgi:hypothetical protein